MTSETAEPRSHNLRVMAARDSLAALGHIDRLRLSATLDAEQATRRLNVWRFNAEQLIGETDAHRGLAAPQLWYELTDEYGHARDAALRALKYIGKRGASLRSVTDLGAAVRRARETMATAETVRALAIDGNGTGTLDGILTSDDDRYLALSA